MEISRMRTLVNKAVGLDVVKVAGQHTLRTHLMAIITAYRIDTIIDVGANEGGFGKFLRNIGFRGAIHSFEPVSAPFKVLEATSRRDALWHVYRCALGAENGTATINVSRFNQMSSFLPASSYGAETWSTLEVESTEEVDVRTLASFYQEGVIQTTGRTLLKMDTQGFDLEVFRGAMPIRDELCCLLSELSLLPLYEGMPDFSEALDTFRRAGFAVTGFFPISRNPHLAMIEVDCILADQTRFEVTVR
jgi:FkbM family methyltransferase